MREKDLFIGCKVWIKTDSYDEVTIFTILERVDNMGRDYYLVQYDEMDETSYFLVGDIQEIGVLKDKPTMRRSKRKKRGNVISIVKNR